MFGYKKPEFKATPQDDGTVVVSAPCIFTKEAHSVTVDAVQYNYYISNGKSVHVQDAFPLESADTREFLASGISPKGWDKAFGAE